MKPKETNEQQGNQTLSKERAQQHAAQNPHDETHSRGGQRDTDSQGHPAPQDRNQQLGREGVYQQERGSRRRGNSGG